MHFLLFYELVADHVQRRGPYRAEHLRLAQASGERGELVLAGALADPVDGAVLVFRGEDDAKARLFAENDPYVKAGLVTRWHVRPWNTVVGDVATATPPNGLPVYRLLTGPDDAKFCHRVSEALALGYRLHGSPAATFDGKQVIVAQAIIWPSALSLGQDLSG